jgi:hypothetical protein
MAAYSSYKPPPKDRKTCYDKTAQALKHCNSESMPSQMTSYTICGELFINIVYVIIHRSALVGSWSTSKDFLYTLKLGTSSDDRCCLKMFYHSSGFLMKISLRLFSLAIQNE